MSEYGEASDRLTEALEGLGCEVERDRLTPDVCETCGKVIGYGVPLFHLGDCGEHGSIELTWSGGEALEFTCQGPEAVVVKVTLTRDQASQLAEEIVKTLETK